MICPECRMENPADVTECIRCGHPLQSPKQSVNQVWNTDIDRAQNRKNSRTALIALAASVVLLLGLVVAMFVSLPSMGDALLGERDEGQRFMERMDEFFQTFADSIFGGITPMPEAYASIPDGPDREFVELFEEYLEKDYDDDYADGRLLSERYYEAFAALKNEHYTDGKMAVYAARTVQALDDLRKGSNLTEDLEDSTTHDILWLLGCTELCAVAEDLYTNYGILYKDRHIPEYYIWLLPIYKAQLEVEQDLTAQLIGIDAEVSDAYDAPYITYTNNTMYELDIIFYNDYETEDDYFYEDFTVQGLQPGETAVIVLQKMPEDYTDWYTDWSLDACYYNGIDIYEYDW